MSTQLDEPPSAGPRQRTVEIGVAAFMIVLGIVVVVGSLQVGIGWGTEGPKSGFFPFWVAILMIATSAYNLARAVATARAGRLFAEWSQINQVGKVVLPLAIYVGVIPWIGIYVASALLVAGFMRWIGRYGWPLTAAIAIALPVVAYVTFENWFLVALPKGPLEDWLGL
jgi:putative tricarboxylic transport membrane protein